MSQRDVTVRPYDESDRPSIISLWNTVFATDPKHNVPALDIDRKLGKDPQWFLVAVGDSGVVGTAMGGWDGHRGWVYAVAVDPAWRRQGIGRLLMQEVETTLAAGGCHKLNLQVRDGNDAATRFYESLGYIVEPRVSMGKILEPKAP